MFPARTDELAWIAESAELPLVGEGPQGLALNGPARAVAGGATRLSHALAMIASVDESDPALVALVEGVRAGARRHERIGDFEVLGSSGAEGSSFLFLPSTVRVSASVQRRAAMSDLAAGVSHELANALGAIVGWVELARQRGEQDPATARALHLIEASARSAHATARHMLETARGAVVGAEGPIDLGVLLHEVLDLLGGVAAEAGVRLERDLPDGVVVRGSRAQLFSVAWNLVQNAVEATPAGGRVHVSLGTQSQMARIVVSDDGPGVPERDRKRILEPYVTTKQMGTGLGLYLVRRALEAANGVLEIGEAEGGGARFVAALPLVARISVLDELGRESGVLERGTLRGKRILVIDDDVAMRELLETALTLQGATVVTAASGEAALASEGSFDLALVDLALGAMRGDAVVAALRRARRVTRAALISGAVTAPALCEGGSPDSWIRKPFEIEGLVVAVRQLLGCACRQVAGTDGRE